MSEEEPLDIMAEDDMFQNDANYSLQGDYTEGIEIFYGNNMSCPVPDCDFEGTFNRKAKYWRHWEERHIKVASKLECCYVGCKSVLRRQSDMRSHFKEKHKEFDDHLIAEIMLKCKTVLVTNKNYIPPGIFTFKGRTPESLASPRPTVKSAVTVPKSSTGSSSKSKSSAKKSSKSSSATKKSSPPATVTVPQTTQGSASVTPCVTTLSGSPWPAITPVTPAKPSASIVTSTLISMPMELEDDTEFNVKIPSSLPSQLASASVATCSSQLVLASSVSSSVSSVPDTSRIIVQESAPAPTYSTPAVSSTATKITVEEYNSRPKVSPSVQPTTTFILPPLRSSSDNSTQTSLMDIKEVYLPPLPDTISELQELLIYLCDNMDRIGRLREAAKLKLASLQQEEPTLQKERELRRKLESENRELKRKLAEIKWRDEMLRSIEM